MKKILPFLFIIASASEAFSQNHLYAAFGYNLGYASLAGLNYNVDRYNITRTWLDEEMGNVHFPNGFTFAVGKSGRRFLFDMTWVGRHQTVSASGTQPNGDVGERELKWRMNSFNIGLGAAFLKTPYARIAVGVSLDLGTERTFTRLKTNGVYDYERFMDLDKNFLVGTTVFVQFIVSTESFPMGLFIRPYIQFPYFKSRYDETANELDEANYQYGDPNSQSKSMNFGVQLMIGLFKRDEFGRSLRGN
ncbi:MAG: hypothetical protein AB7G44_03120 [Bacteroidia bacterium]